MIRKEIQAQLNPVKMKAILEQQARCKNAIAQVKDIVTTSREIIKIEVKRMKLHESILSNLTAISQMPYRGSSGDEMEGALDALKAHYILRGK